MKRGLASVAACIALGASLASSQEPQATVYPIVVKTRSAGLPASALLQNDEVRNDLVLTRTQREAIDAIFAAGQKRDDELFKGIDRHNTDHAERPPFSTSALEWEERETMFVALLSPPQRKRLRALSLQTLGFLALFDNGLQKEIGLSGVQMAKLRSLDQERDARRNACLSQLPPRFTRKQVDEVVARLREQGEREALSVLNKAQQEAYRKLLGKPLEFTTSYAMSRV